MEDKENKMIAVGIKIVGNLIASIGLEKLVRWAFLAGIEAGSNWYSERAKTTEGKSDDIVAAYLEKAVEHIKEETNK